MGSWSNPHGQDNIEALQQRLDEESDFQRQNYCIPAKGYKTRMQLYPQLEEKSRPFEPERFDIKLVYEYLATQVWTRLVRSKGDMKFRNHYINIGRGYAQTEVTVTFDPIEVQWIIRKTDGTLLKTSKQAIPTREDIIHFAWGYKMQDTT